MLPQTPLSRQVNCPQHSVEAAQADPVPRHSPQVPVAAVTTSRAVLAPVKQTHSSLATLQPAFSLQARLWQVPGGGGGTGGGDGGVGCPHVPVVRSQTQSSRSGQSASLWHAPLQMRRVPQVPALLRR